MSLILYRSSRPSKFSSYGDLGECIVGSNVLIPKPIANWSPLAKLIFKFKLFRNESHTYLLRELTIVVRKEAARIKDNSLVVVDINPYVTKGLHE